MYHSIQIIPDAYSIYTDSNKYRGKNTWKDWHLIPSTRPLFNPPEPKTNYLDVPGMNGSIDLSNALSDGYPTFQDRTGSQEFYVMNGYKEWYAAYSDIMNFCHGEVCKVILEDEPSYYYLGRVKVNSWKSEKDWSKIVLDFTLDPYKYELTSSVEPWRWDPFSFIDGIVPEYSVFGQPETYWSDFTITSATTEVVKLVPVNTYPACPVFKITPLSTPGDNCKLTITLYKQYSGSKVEITHNIATCTSSGESTFVFYEMVMRDFTRRDGNTMAHPQTSLGFKCAEGQSFKVSVDFRRGKL